MVDPSVVTNQFHKNINIVSDMEYLSVDNNHHRTPSDVENNNNFDNSPSRSEISSITKMNTRIENLTLGDNGMFIKDPGIDVKDTPMSYYNAGHEDGFSSIIVNIIDDGGNIDAKILSDEEYKYEAFSPKSPDSRSRTPRSKSNSLNSDQLVSQLRTAMFTGDNAILDNGRHLFAKSYEPSRSNKARSFEPNSNNDENNIGDNSRSSSVTPDNRGPERRRRVSYAGHSKICNYGYIGEPRERMFDLLVKSQTALSQKKSRISGIISTPVEEEHDEVNIVLPGSPDPSTESQESEPVSPMCFTPPPTPTIHPPPSTPTGNGTMPFNFPDTDKMTINTETNTDSPLDDENNSCNYYNCLEHSILKNDVKAASHTKEDQFVTGGENSKSYFKPSTCERCGMLFDNTKGECGNKKFNYSYNVRNKENRNKSNVLDFRSHHETSVPTNNSITYKAEKEHQNTLGNSTFYRSIYEEKDDHSDLVDPMKREEVQIMSPLDKVEALSNTMVSAENDGFRNPKEGTGLILCCFCRSENERIVPEPCVEDDRQYSMPDPNVYCDIAAKSIVTASNTATVVATQYVGNFTQTENQEEKKKSKLQHLLQRRHNTKFGSDKQSKSESYHADESDLTDDTENQRHPKKSRNILRRLKKREPEKSSFLKPPSAEYRNKTRLGAEPSDVSNLTVLSIDAVEIIETEYPEVPDVPKLPNEVSGWRKVRNMVQWTPFVQTFKNKKYQWVQLAGHSGNFKAGKCQGTVLKKLCAQEEHCYKQFNLNNGDPIKEYVPGYQGIITLEDDEKFIQLQDCLSSFNLPSIMDCKIGVRTYLEEELAKAKEKPKLRNDMYNKMVAVDSSAPTEEETRLKGVTKPRYMVWRETISSTATLGFRLEGIKKSDGSSSKDFKTTKTKEQVSDAFRNFTSSKCDTVRQYLDRLKEIKIALEQSEFFRTHELIGSSLLFVHDTTKANVWLIDFGKTVPAPNGITIDHKSPWEVGNHEDGYLIGVQNLINIFSDLAVELNTATPTPENHLKTRNSPHHDSRSAILKDDLTNSNVRIDSAKHDMSGPSVMSIESKEDAPIIKNISDSGEVRNNS